MEKRLYEMSCDDGYMVRSEDMDEVIRSGQMHIKEKHHEEVKLEDVRSYVHEVHEPHS